MGFLKDVRSLQKTADQMRPPEHKGMLGGFRAMRDGVATGAQMVGNLGEQQQRTQMLMASGLVGQGTINAIQDTGVTINENPECEISVTVTLPGRDPYQATLKQVVSRIAIPSFQPGATVPVRVSPQDPSVLIIA
jgi:hypothetical protein